MSSRAPKALTVAEVQAWLGRSGAAVVATNLKPFACTVVVERGDRRFTGSGQDLEACFRSLMARDL